MHNNTGLLLIYRLNTALNAVLGSFKNKMLLNKNKSSQIDLQ